MFSIIYTHLEAFERISGKKKKLLGGHVAHIGQTNTWRTLVNKLHKKKPLWRQRYG